MKTLFIAVFISLQYHQNIASTKGSGVNSLMNNGPLNVIKYCSLHLTDEYNPEPYNPEDPGIFSQEAQDKEVIPYKPRSSLVSVPTIPDEKVGM